MLQVERGRRAKDRGVPAVFMLALLSKKDYIVRVRIVERFRFDGGMIRSILKLAIPSGVGASCLTVIGQAVGAGDLDQVKHYMKRMFLISYAANGICVGIFIALTPVLTQLYGYVDEAKAIGQRFCLAFQPFTYPLSFTAPGILKATSDVKYVMYCAVISMFTMRVTLAFLLTTDRFPGMPELGAMGY